MAEKRPRGRPSLPGTPSVDSQSTVHSPSVLTPIQPHKILNLMSTGSRKDVHWLERQGYFPSRSPLLDSPYEAKENSPFPFNAAESSHVDEIEEAISGSHNSTPNHEEFQSQLDISETDFITQPGQRRNFENVPEANASNVGLFEDDQELEPAFMTADDEVIEMSLCVDSEARLSASSSLFSANTSKRTSAGSECTAGNEEAVDLLTDDDEFCPNWCPNKSKKSSQSNSEILSSNKSLEAADQFEEPSGNSILQKKEVNDLAGNKCHEKLGRLSDESIKNSKNTDARKANTLNTSLAQNFRNESFKDSLFEEDKSLDNLLGNLSDCEDPFEISGASANISKHSRRSKMNEATPVEMKPGEAKSTEEIKADPILGNFEIEKLENVKSDPEILTKFENASTSMMSNFDDTLDESVDENESKMAGDLAKCSFNTDTADDVDESYYESDGNSFIEDEAEEATRRESFSDEDENLDEDNSTTPKELKVPEKPGKKKFRRVMMDDSSFMEQEGNESDENGDVEKLGFNLSSVSLSENSRSNASHLSEKSVRAQDDSNVGGGFCVEDSDVELFQNDFNESESSRKSVSNRNLPKENVENHESSISREVMLNKLGEQKSFRQYRPSAVDLFSDDEDSPENSLSKSVDDFRQASWDPTSEEGDFFSAGASNADAGKGSKDKEIINISSEEEFQPPPAGSLLSSTRIDDGASSKYFTCPEASKLEEIKQKIKNNQAKLEPKMTQFLPYQTSDVVPNSQEFNGMTRYEVKVLTNDTLKKLHEAQLSCPKASEVLEQPVRIKTTLRPHQLHALKWLVWRESDRPSGGVLADDMGLGKTLTMISLICFQKENESSSWKTKQHVGYPSNATLVVVPASIMNNWSQEIAKHCRRTSPLTVKLFHGPNRERNPRVLANYDVIITTYATLSREICDNLSDAAMKKEAALPADDAMTDANMSTNTPLLKIFWRRIILDEAHQIRNPKAKCSIAACRVRAVSRWALTGTPVHNKLKDYFSLLRFLRFSPYDQEKYFESQIEKHSQQSDRLNLLSKVIVLRRTKQDVDESGKPLVELPTKNFDVVTLKMQPYERQLHDHLMASWAAKFKKFLEDKRRRELRGERPGRNQMAHFFTAILRLRQTCAHPKLVSKALDSDDLSDIRSAVTVASGENTSAEELANEISKLDVTRPDGDGSQSDEDSEFCFEGLQGFIGREYELDYVSTKLKSLLDSIEEFCEAGEKSVVVSEWTSLLNIVRYHLDDRGIHNFTIEGSVPLKDRDRAINDFNSPPQRSNFNVMLVSLKAGGVGLNLVGGNHLFLLDVHWNPALESQACDRIYRMGQTRNVTIHKLVCENSIEDKVLKIQEKKNQIASSVLSGASKVKKTNLSLDDMKYIFGLGPER